MRKNILIIHLIIIVFFAIILATQSRFTFLIWNLILAVIPFDLSLLNRFFTTKIGRYGLLLVWLLFFPNTLYMVTDFSHLSSIGVGLITPLQFIEYAILAAGILLGVALGLVSLLVMYPLFIPNSQRLTRQLSVLSFLSICSAVAIYLGRFLRINSWDIFVNFPGTVQRILAVLNQPDFWIFVTAFSVLQLTLMLISYQLQQILIQSHS